MKRYGMSIWNAVMVAATCALMAAAPVYAAEVKYSDLVLSDEKDGAAKQVFTPTTPKIFLRAKLTGMPRGTKLKAAWIAEKTKVAPPNYQIDATELTVGMIDNRADFSLSKPNAGWPPGDYRVDLSANGKVVNDVRFKVQ